MTDDTPMVRVAGVSRSHGSGATAVHALRDVSLEVPRGRLVTLVGRSGSGKTTLLTCIGGLDRPTAGRIEVDGVDVTALDEAGRTALRRDRVAFVFQTFGLLPALTAAENVGLPLRLRRAPHDEREDRVAELLDLVGLAAHAGQRPSEMSGGQQQRVAVARALANRPRLLLADEPTGQLDQETGASIMRLLLDVVRAEGTTALISTHDATLQGLADASIRLTDGRVDPAVA
ncbi:ABC transporter ATP-binding protein [Clavibacter phaseoli]|uniref:ABC transporter ATP-binding protein n=2 Tax=Clavibacter phaseoli TaxID=1734031 RepID=UPI001F2E7377|nr:ABC transporter ATP-binding protein [Clavibacter phaseoli]UKF29632.1 ABC transporter ATP-binding protein [Clavibacter phaseoli]UKF38237.1 ABC transporter ATP-binding protein [Clavibacter phaseoli]